MSYLLLLATNYQFIVVGIEAMDRIDSKEKGNGPNLYGKRFFFFFIVVESV